MDVYPVEVFHLECNDESDESEYEDIFIPESVVSEVSVKKEELVKPDLTVNRTSEITVIKHEVPEILANSQEKSEHTVSGDQQEFEKTNVNNVNKRKRSQHQEEDHSAEPVNVSGSKETKVKCLSPKEPQQSESNVTTIHSDVNFLDESAIAASYLSTPFIPDETAATNRTEEITDRMEEQALENFEAIRGVDLDRCIGTLDVTIQYKSHAVCKKNGKLSVRPVKVQSIMFYCRQCFSVFEKKMEYINHGCENAITVTCDKASVDLCSHCNYRAKNKLLLKHHYLDFHNQYVTFKCPICRKEMQFEWELKKHVLDSHVSCFWCKYRATNPRDRLQHISYAHGLSLDEIKLLDEVKRKHHKKEKQCPSCVATKIVHVKETCILRFPGGKDIIYIQGSMRDVKDGSVVRLVSTLVSNNDNFSLDSDNERNEKPPHKKFSQKELPEIIDNDSKSVKSESSDEGSVNAGSSDTSLRSRKRAKLNQVTTTDEVVEIPDSPSDDCVVITDENDSNQGPSRRNARIISLDGDIREETGSPQTIEGSNDTEVRGNMSVSNRQPEDKSNRNYNNLIQGSETFTLENGTTVTLVGDALIDIATGNVVNTVSAVISEEELSALGLTENLNDSGKSQGNTNAISPQDIVASTKVKAIKCYSRKKHVC